MSELALFIEGCEFVGRLTLSPGIVKPKIVALDHVVGPSFLPIQTIRGRPPAREFCAIEAGAMPSQPVFRGAGFNVNATPS